MTSDVNINPTGVGRRGTREVPTIRISDTRNVDIRSAGTVNPVGFRAQEQTYSIVSQRALQSSNRLISMAEGVYAEQERRRQAIEKAEAAFRNEELEAQATRIKGKIEMGQLSDLNLDLAGNFARIQTASGSANETAQLFQVQLEEKTSNLPEEIQSSVMTVQASQANPVLEHQRAKEAQQIAIQAEGDTAQFQDYLKEQAVTYAAPKTADQEVALNAAVQLYNDVIEARTDLTPTQKKLEKEALFEGLNVRASLDYILNSSSPGMTAATVALGRTGIPEIDSMPSTERIKAFNQAQGVIGFLQAEQNRADAQAKEFRARQAADATRAALQAANSNPEEAYAIQEQIMQSAQSPSEVTAAFSLGEKIKEIHEKPFTESDEIVKSAIGIAVTTSALPPDQLQSLIIDKVGQPQGGLSGEDADALLTQIQDQQEGIFSSPQYGTVMIQAETVFPDALLGKEKVNLFANPAAFAAAQNNPITRKQQQMFNAFSTDLRNKISEGQFQSAADMQEYAEKQLSRYSTILQTNLPSANPRNITNVRDFNATQLPDAQFRAYSAALQDEAIVTMANQRYLQNPHLIDEDYRNGDIKEREARMLKALINPIKGAAR